MTDISGEVSPLLRSFVVELSDFRMGKKIGSGGFGEVYLAVHEPTKKECAVKQLFLKDLKGENMMLFKREAEILVACNFPFCLPFLGWTSRYPYSVVTEFIPNGNLFNALRHKKGCPELTPTDKTIIAMGIAIGMDHIHSLGIIHRDLKSLNILIDSQNLPVISDFGLSRYQDEEQQNMTQNVGTSAWMAPETFESTTYDNKVDVYAFGMLMWEMLTEESPFQGMTGIQIAFAVCKNNQRPVFPPDTPQDLMDFISALWSQNPDERPTMRQAFHALKKGRAEYEGTDHEQVKRFLRYVKKIETEHDDENQQERKPPLYTSKGKSHYGGQMSSQGPIMAMLSNPSHANFAPNFTACIQVLNPSNASEFFGYLRKAFSPQTDISTYRLMIPAILNVLSGPDEILRGFAENGLHLKLPLTNEDLNPLCMMILLQVTSRAPTLINSDFLLTLTPILKICPQKILRVISPCCPIFEKLRTGSEISDFLLQHADAFLKGAGRDYLQILFYLSSKYPGFKLSRAQSLNEIIAQAFESSDKAVVHSAYGYICYSFESAVMISTDTLARHLADPSLRNDAASYIIRQNNLRISTELMQALVSNAQTDKTVLVALFQLAAQSRDAGTILISIGDSWLNAQTMQIVDILTLILILLCHKELRAPFGSSKMFGQFLNAMISTRNVDFIKIVSDITLCMSSIPDFLKNLDSCGFFKNLLSTVPLLGDAQSIQMSILLVDTISRSMMINDFLSYVPYLVGMLRNNNEYTAPALSALTAMSTYPNVIAVMNQYQISKFVEVLTQTQAYQPYIVILKQNLHI